MIGGQEAGSFDWRWINAMWQSQQIYSARDSESRQKVDGKSIGFGVLFICCFMSDLTAFDVMW